MSVTFLSNNAPHHPNKHTFLNTLFIVVVLVIFVVNLDMQFKTVGRVVDVSTAREIEGVAAVGASMNLQGSPGQVVPAAARRYNATHYNKTHNTHPDVPAARHYSTTHYNATHPLDTIIIHTLSMYQQPLDPTLLDNTL